MRHVCLGVGIVMLAAPSADAEPICSYGTGYNDPGIHGECMLDAVEGCAIHLLRPHEPPPVQLSPIVYRNAQVITVTSTTAVVGTLDTVAPTIDYYSCSCDRGTAVVEFDEIALTIPGARAGDDVSLGDGSGITIGPRLQATCPTPTWEVRFDFQLGGCDLCPPDDHASSGCATTPGASLIPGVLALWIARRRFRRDACGRWG